MNKVDVNPELLRRACERAGYDSRDLAHRIPQLLKEAYNLTGLRGGAFQQYARRRGMDLP